MKCPVCGTQVADGTKFCIYCGAPLQKPEPKLEVPVEEAPAPDPVPELVLEPSMEEAVEAAAQEAKEALDQAIIDPFADAAPVAPDPVYRKPEPQPAPQAAAQQARPVQPTPPPVSKQPYQNTYSQPQGGVYGQPYPGAPAQSVQLPGHGTAIASLICGCASLLMIILSAGLLSIPLGVAGIITGIISKNAGNTEGIRKAGFITSLVGLILSILFLIACVACVAILGE